MKYIIIDLNTNKALYALNGITIQFSTELAAEELAKQMCKNYLIISIKLNL
jgi:hypothetical protein